MFKHVFVEQMKELAYTDTIDEWCTTLCIQRRDVYLSNLLERML